MEHVKFLPRDSRESLDTTELKINVLQETDVKNFPPMDPFHSDASTESEEIYQVHLSSFYSPLITCTE